jgi:hypothetical protein
MNTDYRENFLYRPHKRLKTSTNSELRTEEDSGVEDILRTVYSSKKNFNLKKIF